MARRNMTQKLIHISKINEQMKLIDGSETDYITPTGKVYKDYGNNFYYPKTNFINKATGYVCCGITFPDGNKQRRIHVLLAKAYIPNPNNYPVVMHLDNDKTNYNLNNLKWGTVSQNTKAAFDDKLQVNDKSWNDNQSIHVCCFDMNKNLLNKYGSIGEASRCIGVTKTTILNQCNHNVKTKPRCGYYFRYLSEYEKNGFVL